MGSKTKPFLYTICCFIYNELVRHDVLERSCWCRVFSHVDCDVVTEQYGVDLLITLYRIIHDFQYVQKCGSCRHHFVLRVWSPVSTLVYGAIVSIKMFALLFCLLLAYLYVNRPDTYIDGHSFLFCIVIIFIFFMCLVGVLILNRNKPSTSRDGMCEAMFIFYGFWVDMPLIAFFVLLCIGGPWTLDGFVWAYAQAIPLALSLLSFYIAREGFIKLNLDLFQKCTVIQRHDSMEGDSSS